MTIIYTGDKNNVITKESRVESNSTGSIHPLLSLYLHQAFDEKIMVHS